ncbi:MAG TPA: outer membrane beta-barrel protein [Steroidobacteraceae bacterium]|nr:outer membrane beta-barrel protein [Steroidobacteraceae bacterium]
MQRKYGWLAGLALAATATTATAAESGFYFGGALGQSSYDVKKGDADAIFDFALFEAGNEVGFDVLDTDSDMDKSDTLFGALVGYQFGPYFAVEAAYLDLGKADYDNDAVIFSPTLGGMTINGGLSLESSGPALSGIGILPLSESFDLYARLGVFFSDTKLKVSIEGESDSLSGNDEDLFYGLGASWNIGTSWTLRLEYQMFEKVGKKNETGEGDVDAVTLGVLYRL